MQSDIYAELSDIAAYLGALRARIVGQILVRIRLNSAFLLRTIDPLIEAVEGNAVCL